MVFVMVSEALVIIYCYSFPSSVSQFAPCFTFRLLIVFLYTGFFFLSYSSISSPFFTISHFPFPRYLPLSFPFFPSFLTFLSLFLIMSCFQILLLHTPFFLLYSYFLITSNKKRREKKSYDVDCKEKASW